MLWNPSNSNQSGTCDKTGVDALLAKWNKKHNAC